MPRSGPDDQIAAETELFTLASLRTEPTQAASSPSSRAHHDAVNHAKRRLTTAAASSPGIRAQGLTDPPDNAPPPQVPTC